MLKVIESVLNTGNYFLLLESNNECVAGPFNTKKAARAARRALHGFEWVFGSDGLVVLNSGKCSTCGLEGELYGDKCITCKVKENEC